MIQSDFFISVVTAAPTITQDNELVLVPPSLRPTGYEAAERKAARLREIEDRKAWNAVRRETRSTVCAVC